MITSAKNYPKKEEKMDRQNPRTNVKAKLYRQNHSQKHTHTHSQKEKKEKNIYSCFQNPPPHYWYDSFSIQVFHRCRVH